MLEGGLCRLRPYRANDAASICAVADDYLVARWMTRAFPHPYTQADAEQWLSIATNTVGRYFAIEVACVVAGGIGIEAFEGEREGGAAFGYWLGRAYWGRGIGTDAARTLADHALASGTRRWEAAVFAQNVASARVLAKCGFELEGRLQGLCLDREGRICDGLLFARLV